MSRVAVGAPDFVFDRKGESIAFVAIADLIPTFAR